MSAPVLFFMSVYEGDYYISRGYYLLPPPSLLSPQLSAVAAAAANIATDAAVLP